MLATGRMMEAFRTIRQRRCGYHSAISSPPHQMCEVCGSAQCAPDTTHQEDCVRNVHAVSCEPWLNRQRKVRASW